MNMKFFCIFLVSFNLLLLLLLLWCIKLRSFFSFLSWNVTLLDWWTYTVVEKKSIGYLTIYRFSGSFCFLSRKRILARTKIKIKSFSFYFAWVAVYCVCSWMFFFSTFFFFFCKLLFHSYTRTQYFTCIFFRFPVLFVLEIFIYFLTNSLVIFKQN